MKPAAAELPHRSYALVYRGLKADAQLAALKPILSRQWQLTGRGLDRALSQPPHRLTTGTDLAVLCSQQKRLAQMGCEAAPAALVRYRHWNIDSDTLKRIDERASATRLELALLQVSPPPGAMRLQWAARGLDGVVGSVLNGAQLLLEFTRNDAAGYGPKLLKLQATLESALREQNPEEPPRRSAGAVALSVDDGTSLIALLDVLQDRLSSSGGRLPDSQHDVQAIPQRVLAGRGWGRVVRWGLKPAPTKTLTAAMVRDIELSWPLEPPKTDGGAAVPQTRLDLVLDEFRSGEPARAQQGQELVQRMGELSQLPSLPELALQVHRLASDPESDSEELGRLVGSDPGLSSQVLSRVNSAYYGLRHRIDSVAHAVVILGFEELATLSLGLASQPLFLSMGRERGQRLWRHCALTATMARALAARWGLEQPAFLYTAGLLHDVGKVFLFHVRKAVMAELENEAKKLRLPVVELEREYFAHDHASLGGMLLTQWGLPESLARCVEEHHGPRPGGDSIALESALIGVADHLAHRLVRSEPWADDVRVRRAHQEALRPVSDDLSGAALDQLLSGAQMERQLGAL